MKRWIEWSMQRVMLMVICMVLLIGWGGISAYQMQRDYLPSMNNTTLLVSLRASGMSADQIKQNVTAPIESAVRRCDGISTIETNSYDGGLLVSLYYPMDYDMTQAENQVKQVLSTVDLPSGINTPSVTRVTTNSFPILSYSLSSSSKQIDDISMQSTIPGKIASPLKTVPGVADVQMTGAAKNGWVITIHTKDLTKYGLTMKDVTDSLTTANVFWSAGKIANGKLVVPVTVEGFGLINDVPIGKDGKQVSLSAIADVSKSLTDVKTISRTKGKPSVILNVLKTPSANITDVSEQVKERLQKNPLVQSHQVHVDLLLDREQELNSALQGLIREGLLGCLFSMLCVFFFFRNIRSTLIIAISLPISLLATTAIIHWMGYTLNILTVSGMIVAMGRIVDDSIVILDNIYRRVQESKEGSLLSTMATAVYEMIPAIFASTATTIAVYVPIAMVGGIVSASFSGFAWSVVIALVVSFFVAMLVIPTLSFARGKEVSHRTVTLEKQVQPLLQFAFHHKKLVVFVSLLLFIGAAVYSAFLPINFLPSGRSGQVSIKVELPKGSTLAQVDAEVKKVEEVLQANSAISSYSSSFGSNFTPQSDDVFDEGGGFIQQPNVANLSVTVKNKGNLDTLTQRLQQSLSHLSTNVNYTVANQNMSGDDSQLKVILSGSDANTLEQIAQTIRDRLSTIPGLSVDGKNSTSNETPKYTITLDPNKVKQLGVSLDDLSHVLNKYTAQVKDFDVIQDHRTVSTDLYLNQLDDKQTKSSVQTAIPSALITALSRETVQGKNGQTVRLDQVATITPDHSPSSIQERDGEPFTAVTAQITSSDIGKVSDQVQQKLDQLKLPHGVTYSIGGITEQIKQMILDMSLALMFSVLLVLMIISSVFRGWKAPLSVLLSVPLALSGVVLFLLVFGGQWNLAALIGVLMLVGIVVTNAIVMIDKIERNRRSGMELREAIMAGTLSRVRPIFMTAGTTVLTLLPLAFSHSSDTVVSQTLGWVVIGGMITSTLNSLLLIPIIYESLQGKRQVEKDSGVSLPLS